MNKRQVKKGLKTLGAKANELANRIAESEARDKAFAEKMEADRKAFMAKFGR